MKKVLFALTISLYLFAGCKEDDPTPEQEPDLRAVVMIEGKPYDTNTINGQEWTLSNYNGSKGVYYNNTTNNFRGKLLTLKETKQIPLPEGWRIPTVADYVKLINKYGGFINYNSTGTIDKSIIDKNLKPDAAKALMSLDGWVIAGTNANYFNAVPVGFYDGSMNAFTDAGVFTCLWTSDIYQSNSTYLPMLLGIYSEKAGIEAYFAEHAEPINSLNEDTKGRGSIRFVRDK